MELSAVVIGLLVLAAVGAGAVLAVSVTRSRAVAGGSELVDTVVAVAGQRLGATHVAIDGQLRSLSEELARLSQTVTRLEAERGRQHGELAAQLRASVDQTASLSSTASALREVLASPKARGQWGERMADDVLRLSGLVEGISYVRQRALPGGTVPDFTFLLPRGLVLHMDAKFPVANYARCLGAGSDSERAQHRRAFLRDVRARVRELSGRNYVDPANGTLDYVLAFIPNESIYAFVHQHDPELVEVALRQKVVLCSPLSLFAVLAVVRQAVDTAALARTSGEILSVLGAFTAQWERFCAGLDKVGRAVDGVESAYRELAGTRRRALERPLARVEELRRQRGLAGTALDRAGDGKGTEPPEGLHLVAAAEGRAPPGEQAEEPLGDQAEEPPGDQAGQWPEAGEAHR
jgi:DNA recombination protein RmuC